MRAWRIWKRRIKLLMFLVPLPLLTMCFLLLSFQSPPKSDISGKVSHGVKQQEYVDKRGIHVIVGHYMGSDPPWEIASNLTQDLMDRNGYSPIASAGRNGDAYFVLPSEQKTAKALFRINKFNLMVSDRIPLNRSLPDVRKQACQVKSYAVRSLPDTSIIIVYHNEAWSTLLRTVYSVINRSPRRLLKEIILVDDASDRQFLKEPLDRHVASLNVPVRILRSATRIGLVKARLMGASAAQGLVLTFLDAHCECTKGWLEPLLSRIADNRTTVVCPVIDIIHDETFSYVRSFELHWGAFNWELHFRWYPVPERELLRRKNDSTAPFRTPVMAGGLFSIDKSYFEEIGSYDDKIDIWGGENIELSFRVWQCGGSIEISPCSHVGHVFRRSSPYTFPRPGGVGGVLFGNLARVALTWMDEWSKFYFSLNPEAGKIASSLDVSDRLDLRQTLKCESFKWYLDNVWPEHNLPEPSRFFGKMRSQKTGKCVQRISSDTSRQHAVGKVNLRTCVFEIYSKQLVIYTKDGRVMADESVCLDSPEGAADTYVLMLACNALERQRWHYDVDKQTLKHSKSKLCLDLPSKHMPDGLILQPCNGGRSQLWSFEPVDWYHYTR